jgi:tetratricopeptide (TPR) repeat protein
MWETSVALDPSLAITHRNLAIAYMHQKSGADLDKAIAEMEKAVSLEPRYALHFTELDELYEQAGTPLEKRLTLIQKNASLVAQRDDAVNREIALQIATGQVDDAIQTMTTRTFAVAEGANLNVVDHWTDAHLLRAQKEIQAQRYVDALKDLQVAATIPANLPIGIGVDIPSARSTELDYWTGIAYADSRDTQRAEESWKLAVAQPDPSRGRRANPPRIGASQTDQTYYKGLSLQKLGQKDKAEELFRDMVQSGHDDLQQPAPSRGGSARHQASPRIREANAHYLAGLGYLGLQNQAAAKAELRQAAQLSPDLLGARTALASLQ